MDLPEQRYRIAKKLWVTFSLADNQMRCEWEPDVPEGLSSGKLYARYKAARADFLEACAAAAGGPVLMIDQNGVSAIKQPETH